jgi:hypothetical protein
MPAALWAQPIEPRDANLWKGLLQEPSFAGVQQVRGSQREVTA